MPVAFAPDFRAPGIAKDRRLVVRCAAGLPTKDLATFFDVARRCPGHRFLLAVARAARHEGVVEELLDANRALGSPAEIRVDQSHEAVAALFAEAGLYLHTFGLQEPYGMPISIAEAMSHGCTVVARRAPGAAEYVGPAGRLYDDADGATALVQATAAWSDAEWERARVTAIDWSWSRYADANVMRPLLDEWCTLRAARVTMPARALG
jgi:glycosyltransferase involved in cell wall biosynthesis